MKEQKLRKVTRCFLIGALCVSIVANVISIYYQYSVSKLLGTKFENKLTKTDILTKKSENRTFSVTFVGDKENEKTERDFFSSEKEALENPFEVISSENYISALVQCDERIKLTMRFDYTEEKQWLVEVKSYGDNSLFESISIPKMSEYGLYIIQTNYNGMNKYLAFFLK